MTTCRVLIVVVVAALLMGGCTSTTFMISKGERSYYLGRKSSALYDMLCASGDLRRVLAETTIAMELKEDFYRYNCTDDVSREKVLSVYVFFTPEEKKELKSAFRRHGYDINSVNC